MADESICDHYHIATRRVSLVETLRTAWWFHQQFSDQVLRREQHVTRLTQWRLLFGMVRRLQQAMGRHLARRFA